MKEIIEKGVLTTIGIGLLVLEKADEIIKDMVDKGKILPDEGKQFLDDFTKQVNQEKEDLKSKIDKTVHSALKDVGLATKEEVNNLVSEVKKLQDQIVALEDKMELRKHK